MLQLVVSQLRVWDEGGIRVPVSMNVSALDMIDERFADYLTEQIEGSGLPAGRLRLEITETALLHEAERGRVVAERLHAMGIPLVIDDFGVGFAPLTYLSTFPLGAIKLDRSFVVDLPGSTQQQTIVKSLVDLAHALGLEVVAEGVETFEVADVLRDLGCDHAQGYVFARPGTTEEFERLWNAPPADWRPDRSPEAGRGTHADG